MFNFKPTIGMEIHVELKTKTKMFCLCLNDPSEQHPNINVCPICLGHPGVLPTINEEAIKKVIMVGLALGGKVSRVAKFDRKNYFYPDLPKGYQISQYEEPLITGGSLNNIRIRRIHLEEDTGTLIHDTKINQSLVDFNRAGIPLMELVTEPDISSAKEARTFCEDLQLILKYLNVSSADMEKGEMRLEANISINMGTKAEIKNINSFRALEWAINYEIERQISLLQQGKKIIQETRGWDDEKKETFSQRGKEEEQDYRYFPEPDLPPFETEIFNIEFLKKSLPELPHQKQERFEREFNLSHKQAKILVQNKFLAQFFEEAISELKTYFYNQKDKNPTDLLYNYLTTDLMGLLNEFKDDFYVSESGAIFAGQLNPHKMAHLISLILDSKIGSRQAKDILRISFKEGRDPEEIMKNEGLETISTEEELLKILKSIIEQNEKAVLDYRKGKESAVQFLVGQTMKAMRGRGDPNIIRKKIIELLK